MKKIKLLMPILGLGSIATTVIPMTSCGSSALAGITIKEAPTEFKVGQTFDTSSLVLNAIYTNGSTKDIKEGFTTDFDNKVFDNQDVGTHIVTVTYKDGDISKNTVFTIKVSQELGITREQWSNAFAKIKNPWDTERNFTIDGNVFGDPFSANCVGTINEGWCNFESSSNPDIYYSMLEDGVFWNMSFNNEGTAKIAPSFLNWYLEDEPPMIDYFIVLGNLFDYWYDYVDRVNMNELKYRIDLLNFCDIYDGYATLEFDSQYRISKVELKFALVIEEYEVPVSSCELNFTKYGDTQLTTDVKKKFEDEGLANYKTTASKSGEKYVAESTLDDVSSAFIFDKPEISDLNTIKPTDSEQTFSKYGLVLNGESLEEDTDFTTEVNDNGYVTSIKLNTPLTSNDKLILLANGEYGGKLKVELIKG